MDTFNFILLMIVILVILYMFNYKERFTVNKEPGLYNYFFQSYMNPYPLPLNKFFSNDKEEIVNE